MPSKLPGGEQQLVSIIRVMVNRPPVILADEPTAPLDSERALTELLSFRLSASMDKHLNHYA